MTRGDRMKRLATLISAVVLATSTMACSSTQTDGASTDSKDESSQQASDRQSSDGQADEQPSAGPTTRGEDPSEPSEIGTFVVGRANRTIVDSSRVTTAHGGQPELTSRTLETVVLYPASKSGEGSEPLAGPWPLIVFSHGSTRAGIDYIKTLSAWVSAGYVVAAPSFPLSRTGTPGGTNYGDYESQSADVSLVIDSLLADESPAAAKPNAGAANADTEGTALSDIINPDRIGLGGQSFGAITTLGAVAAKCCADNRVDVATEFAGVWLPFSTASEISSNAKDVPILFVHGSKDPTLPYDNGRAAWQMIGAPGGFLTLVGTGHDEGFFDGSDDPLDSLVTSATLAFYDGILKGDDTARRRIDKLVSAAGPEKVTFDVSENGF